MSDDDQRVDLKDYLQFANINRRQAMKAGMGLSAGLLGVDFLAACAAHAVPEAPKAKLLASRTAGAGSPTSVAGTPRNQTVVLDQTPFTVFDSFNQFIPNGNDFSSGMLQVCWEYCWYLNLATGQLKPWLATGYKYNSDFTQFTMNLNPKAAWSDGQPFTSQDVEFTINMLNKYPTLINALPTTNSEVASIETPDAHTLVVNLNTPDARYHYNYICGICTGYFIVPQHIWESQDPTTFQNNPPILTGPYKLSQALRNEQIYLWEKNPNYWNKSVMDPVPQYVAWRTASTDEDVAISQFKQAETDNGSDYEHVKAAISGGYKQAEIVTKMLDPCERAIWLNTKSPSSGGFLQDHRARWAISRLINRQKIADAIWIPSTQAAVFPWAAYPGNKKWELPDVAKNYPLTYDPSAAAKLLDEMGAKKGSGGKRMYKGQQVSLQIITPGLPTATGQEYAIGQLLVQELESAGIQASLKYLASAVFTQKYETGDFDLISWWLCGELLDPWQVYQQFLSKYYVPIGQTATSSNYTRVKDSEFDAAVEGIAKYSPSSSSAKPYFKTAMERWYADMSVIPTIQTVYTQQFNTTYWKGWPSDSNLYEVPDNWWGQFMFVIGNLKAAGS